MSIETIKPYGLNPIFGNISIDPAVIQQIIDAICHPGWLTDYNTALFEAKTHSTLVLAAFTGYNWCPYCQALEKEVFNTCEFGMWTLSKRLILLNIDVAANPIFTPPPPEQKQLLEKYHVVSKPLPPAHPDDTGYPTVMALNADGTVRCNRCAGYKIGSGVTAWINRFEEKACLDTSSP